MCQRHHNHHPETTCPWGAELGARAVQYIDHVLSAIIRRAPCNWLVQSFMLFNQDLPWRFLRLLIPIVRSWT